MSYNLNDNSGVTLALSTGALAIGSTTSQFALGSAVNYLLNGQFGQRTAIATQALVIEPNTGIVPTAPNTLQSLAIGEACTFLVLADSANSLTVVQSVKGQAGAKQAVAAVPGNRVAVGVIKVQAVTAAFVPGTTAFNAAGITTTYFNVGCHPGVSL